MRESENPNIPPQKIKAKWQMNNEDVEKIDLGFQQPSLRKEEKFVSTKGNHNLLFPVEEANI
jgi:hypothetical protein